MRFLLNFACLIHTMVIGLSSTRTYIYNTRIFFMIVRHVHYGILHFTQYTMYNIYLNTVSRI